MTRRSGLWVMAVAAVVLAMGCAGGGKADTATAKDSVGVGDLQLAETVAVDLVTPAEVVGDISSADLQDQQVIDAGSDLSQVADTSPPDQTVNDALVDLSETPDAQEPSKIASLMVVVRTPDQTNYGTNDSQAFCVDTDRCWGLDNLEINDFERGQVDHFVITPDNLQTSDLKTIILKTLAGTDAWRPDCLAVVADGKLIYCNDQDLDIWIGNDTGEVTSFTDDVGKVLCGGCYPSVITHGPMVGHTTMAASTIWLRTSYSVPVTVSYGLTKDTLSQISDSVTAKMADDFTLRVPLTGLTPATRYFYRVDVEGSAPSAVYSFRTAPTGAGVVSIAFGSCAKNESQPIFKAMKTSEPDLLLMIGDNHYSNTTDPARLNYFYRNSRGIADFAEVLHYTPTWATWDDHDYTGNNTNYNVANKLNALHAFQRYWANPGYGTDNQPGVWTTFSWGDVQVFLLDDRYYRGQNGSMLGPTQLAWLKSGLAASTATFKILASGSQWTSAGSNDSWAQFNSEREEILDFIMTNKINGVVLISGDVHFPEVRRLRAKSASTYEIWEFTSSPLANATDPCRAAGADLQTYCGTGFNNFGLLRIDTTSVPQLIFEIRDESNTVRYAETVSLEQLSLP